MSYCISYSYLRKYKGTPPINRSVKPKMWAYPINGRLTLGTWQGMYLFEHRTASHRREVWVRVMGIRK